LDSTKLRERRKLL